MRRGRRCSRAPRRLSQELLAVTSAEELPHVAAWRDAYRAFGAKPQRTRNSLEALRTPRSLRSSAGQPADRHLQRHQRPPPGPARRGGHRPPTSARRGSSAPPAPSRSTRSPTASPSWSIPTRERSCGVTTPASPAAAGTGARVGVPSSRRTPPVALFILDALEPMTDDALTAAGEELVAHLAPARHRRPCRYSPRQIPDLTATSSMGVDLMPRRRGSRRPPGRTSRGTGRSHRARSPGR